MVGHGASDQVDFEFISQTAFELCLEYLVLAEVLDFNVSLNFFPGK